MAPRPTLVVMVKEPRPGRVKTRLGREIGHVTAAWWMRHQVARLLRRLRNPKWRLVLAVAPDTALASPAWPADLPRMAQGGGDLGDRMRRAFVTGAQHHRGPICIIGADIPAITPAHIDRALAALGSHDAVLGPASDGGYWLIGLKRPATPPGTLFTDVRWSTEHALTDTLAGLRGLSVAQIDMLDDVDEAADLRR
ncbi:TIGR04282 family arsenosugar biosynthesis glycosyltransferase [Pseudooceanicola atlanticus]|uniref:Glycosyltransferase n=1 Tax=Pseudooceanicola atlanticus TaxID=1461694 RepID=A0A0A0ELY1_9RHOB|nr:TIGR04282 family arsenosugar biosynthesis glycosyltransferase [Pseudooceanicola atlanticus]KGM50197.1 hypothetical protein ATO9_01460 [Pseudooceanicola atlanticus]